VERSCYKIDLFSPRKRSALDARWRSAIKDAIDSHLRTAPTLVSKSRIKRLRELQRPQYRLRVDEFRVFYDVIESDVLIIAIVPKAEAENWLTEFGIRPQP
jgi:mRNA interferase RelE/StbE